MRNSVNEHMIHRGQYRGLSGRDCTTITFLEEARLDYSTLTRYSYCNFNNNATACYDQILCAIASLCGRKYGIHKDVVFVHAKMLEEAEFKLKISTKISETSYKHCHKSQFQMTFYTNFLATFLLTMTFFLNIPFLIIRNLLGS